MHPEQMMQLATLRRQEALAAAAAGAGRTGSRGHRAVVVRLAGQLWGLSRLWPATGMVSGARTAGPHRL